MSRLSRFMVLLLLIAMFSLSPTLHAQSTNEPVDNSGKEFIMSCTYGILAGTLVGVAMLAFTDQPGENLSKVARGASIGLYTGILLGLYVVYVVPKQNQPEDPELLNGPSEGWRAPQGLDYQMAILPTWNQDKVDGATFSAEILRF